MLWGVIRYEYRMAIGRWGVWFAFLLAALLSLGSALTGPGPLAGGGAAWNLMGSRALMMNVWMPLIAGIALADRLPREHLLLTWELLETTLAPRGRRILGKYLGGLLAVCTPVLVFELLGACIDVARGAAAAQVPVAVLAFLAINLPALAFVGAFSIACPAVLPVRIYQVLFAGYWFWGNFMNPRAFPTIAGSVLTASGQFAAEAFFGARFGSGGRVTVPFVALNLCVLAACAVAALVAVTKYLEWQARRL